MFHVSIGQIRYREHQLTVIKCVGFFERDFQRYSSRGGVMERDGDHCEEARKARFCKIVHKILISCDTGRLGLD
jgi:hypothetical protein